MEKLSGRHPGGDYSIPSEYKTKTSIKEFRELAEEAEDLLNEVKKRHSESQKSKRSSSK
ncbi:MAG: hypothetical protein AAF632_18600 [Bacteroidota bacterium]